MENMDNSLLDHSTSLVNFSCSLLHHFGAPITHKTIPEVDEALLGAKKVAVFLFDGSGKYNLSLYPHTTKFVREHALMTIHSVNPATTVACTTAFLSAKFPIENGWLGWSLYFDEYKANIDVFPNRYSSNGEKVPDDNVMDKKCHYINLAEQLASVGVKAKLMFQYPVNGDDGPKNFKEANKKASDFFADGGQFLYGYFPEPDHSEHKYGVKSFHVRHKMASFVRFLKKWTKEHPDVVTFSFADHGLINVTYRDLDDFPDITDCLAKPSSIEGRTPTFFIKEGRSEDFKQAFNKHFGDDFYLMDRDEVFNSGYFGEGNPCLASKEFIGDFVAVSMGKDLLLQKSLFTKIHLQKGHHAGGTKEEREVLLAVYNSSSR